MIDISVVHWHMGEDGWTFTLGPGVIPDQIAGSAKLHQIYTLSDPQCTSRVTVPVLFDSARMKIVFNESADIMRMFNSAFDLLGARHGDYYPAAHRTDIDRVNARICDGLNNGVYQAGFAATQSAYEEAVAGVFETLEWLEERLALRRYLVSDTLAEADIRLFTILIRFDAVYSGHFKCNRRALADFPSLWNYVRAFYQNLDIRPTVDFDHIKKHYYGSLPPSIRPASFPSVPTLISLRRAASLT